MEKIVQLTNVTKYYGRGNMVTKALDGISFAVGEGEFTAIMGASGSGKSTLLNVIATIDRVSSGDICIRGKHLPQMKKKIWLYSVGRNWDLFFRIIICWTR